MLMQNLGGQTKSIMVFSELAYTDHLEQARRFILKNGFQEPINISCDLKTGNAYIIEGNHHLWVAHKEGIPSIPCCVIPH